MTSPDTTNNTPQPFQDDPYRPVPMGPVEDLFALLAPKLQQLPEESQRIFHGRGQTHPPFASVVIDWHPPVLFVQLFKEIDDQWIEALVASLLTLPVFQEEHTKAKALLVQKRFVKPAETTCHWGEIPNECYALEDGLRYQLNLLGHQNIGFFMDMRNGRRWLQERVAGKKVLNLFAYTCSFSVVAMAAGAAKVVNVDMSRSALRTGEANHQHNGQSLDDVIMMGHDIFRSWGKIKRFAPYDVIIADPPSHQRGSFIAKRDYGRLIQRLPDLLKEGGELLSCLNAPNLAPSFLLSLAEERCPTLTFQERLPVPDDFPDRHPDRSLKAMHFIKEIQG